MLNIPNLPKKMDGKMTPCEIFCSIEDSDSPAIFEYTLRNF